MKFNILFACVLLVIFISSFPTNLEASLRSADIIAEVNVERVEHGLKPLKYDSILSSIAQSRSVFLSQQGQIFHVSAPAGQPWLELWNYGYQYQYAGENLALGIESPRELARRWMDSPSHRVNILNSTYEDAGVGVITGLYAGRPASYVVMYYGKKRPGTEPVSRSVADASFVPKTEPVRSATQATVVSAGRLPQVLPATHVLPVSAEQEQRRILTELVILLDSYLRLLKNAG